MNDITIRPARPEEVRQAIEFAQKIFEKYVLPDYEPPAAERLRNHMDSEEQVQEYIAGKNKMFVAVDGERIIGMACERDSCHIRKLYVDGAYQRRGIATKLLDFLITAMNVPRVTLNSSPYGLPFYLQSGFVATDTEQNRDGFVFTPMAYERTQSITIRPVQPEEVRPAIDLALRVFMRYSAPLLKAESVEFFRTSCGDEAMLEKYILGEWRMFAAFDGAQMVGMTCEREGAHISKLYVDPDYHRQGIATKLLDALITAMDVPRVTLNASPYGLPFYTKYGFLPTGEKDPWIPILTPMAYERSNNVELAHSEPRIGGQNGR